MIRSVFTVAAGAVALAAAFPGAAHAQASPPEFSDYVAALQGEWESRFCEKDYRWTVNGSTVTMSKHSTAPNASYDNRYPVGAKIMVIGEIYRQTPNMVQFKITRFEPNGSQNAPGDLSAITYTPVMDGVPVRYFTFSDMWRPAMKAKMCK